jgi:hypothetical protein
VLQARAFEPLRHVTTNNGLLSSRFYGLPQEICYGAEILSIENLFAGENTPFCQDVHLATFGGGIADPHG